jgi:carboxyl-terminal processing protease
MRAKLSSFGPLIFSFLLLFMGVFVEYEFQLVDRFFRPQLSVVNRDSSLSRVTRRTPPSDKSDVNFQAFWETWQILERDYLDPEQLDSEKMVDGAISGMTAALGDPYTTYLSPADKERSSQDLAGSFYGVGIELGYIDGVLAVIAPLAETPAEQAGVRAEDLIIRVRDEQKEIDSDTSGWSLMRAVDTIRGPRGSSITLTLVRQGESEPFEVTLQRGEIIVKSAQLEFVQHRGKRVAHIKLSRFGERTNGEWDSVVTQILNQRQQIDGIVLDMRNNPGGFFDGAIDVASEFIDRGTVVTQKGKITQQSFSVRGRARLSGIPVEVLVNRGSASASEIVAGALRDRLGSKLIGEQTFGKGTVQDRRELSNGGGLHVTVSRWMLPGGDWIHDEGIPVDIEVVNDPETEADEALLRAIEEF